jgi:multiple sugar transport system permease protein
MVEKAKRYRVIFSSRNMLILTAILPTVIFYIIFAYGAMIYAFYLSLHNWTLGQPIRFIGFSNYLKVLKEDPLFYKSLGNTFYYSIVVVPLGGILALLLAVGINGLGKLASVFRIIYFAPVVSSLVAISVVWRWLYQPEFGLINEILGILGGPKLMWLQDPHLAMPAVIIMAIWHGVGYTMVIFLAGLQGIPQTFYDAAVIDGANRWQLLRHITVPLLMPTIIFVLVTGVIGSFQVFTEMFVLLGSPGSGPLNSTRTIVVHLYERAFSYFQLGYASATAFILFGIILIFTIIQLRLLRIQWEY